MNCLLYYSVLGSSFTKKSCTFFVIMVRYLRHGSAIIEKFTQSMIHLFDIERKTSSVSTTEERTLRVSGPAEPCTISRTVLAVIRT